MEDHVGLLFVVLGVVASMQLASIAKSLASLSASSAGTAVLLKRLLAHHGIDGEAEAEPSQRVRALALDAKTDVDAIKAYREQTGLGLREAKAVVDRLAQGRQPAA